MRATFQPPFVFLLSPRTNRLGVNAWVTQEEGCPWHPGFPFVKDKARFSPRLLIVRGLPSDGSRHYKGTVSRCPGTVSCFMRNCSRQKCRLWARRCHLPASGQPRPSRSPLRSVWALGVCGFCQLPPWGPGSEDKASSCRLSVCDLKTPWGQSPFLVTERVAWLVTIKGTRLHVKMHTGLWFAVLTSTHNETRWGGGGTGGGSAQGAANGLTLPASEEQQVCLCPEDQNVAGHVLTHRSQVWSDRQVWL